MRIVATLLSALSSSLFCLAQSPVPLPGFPVTIVFHAGETVSGGPAVVDLTGDGKMEIVVPGREFMYVFRYDGSLLPGWPQQITHQYDLRFAPAVGDITGDGVPEILCLTTWWGAQPWEYDSTFLFAWRSTGELVPGFPVSYGNAFHSPVLYDVDGDGAAEIIIAWSDLGICMPHRMTVLNGDGSPRPGWPRPIGSTYAVHRSAPAVGDIDGDGVPEIVYSTRTCDESAAQVFVWNALTGEPKPGFPFQFPPLFDNSGDRILLPPDSLGRRLILTYATYLLFPSWEDSTLVYVIEPDGTIAPGWPQPMSGYVNMTQFAVGELFGNSLLIALSEWAGVEVRVWSLMGQIVTHWPGPPVGSWNHYMMPARLEWPQPVMQIAQETSRNLNFPNPGPVMGGVFGRRSDGASPPWSPLVVRGWTGGSPPTFGDINGDGIADLVIVADDDSIQLQRAYVHAYTFPGVPFNRENFPWPTAGHDRWRTSQYGFVPPDSIVVSVREPALLPDKIILHQNYPNPFNPSTRITYELPQRTHVRLLVSNVLGQTVKILVDEERPSGRHHAWFDATGLASGVYFYRLEGEGVRMVRKMVMLR